MKLKQAYVVMMMRVIAATVFAGRAYQHVRWDAPLRTLLWSQRLMEPIVDGVFGVPWESWAGSVEVDGGIELTVRIMGGIYALCAVFCLTVTKERRVMQGILAFGGLLLCFLTLLYAKRYYFNIGQIIEYSLQWSAPFLLIAAVRGGFRHSRWRLGLKLCIALAFVGHGLYAVGFHPQPGHFVTMVMNTTGMGEDAARQALVWAGLLDFAVAVMIFVPKVERPALIYAALWGFATAFARLVSHYDAVNPGAWLDAWAYQTMYRLCHGACPLVALWLTYPEQGAPEAEDPSFHSPAMERST